jgi:hypothetical protein
MTKIFVSKSGQEDNAAISRLQRAIGTDWLVTTEDDFRQTAKSVGYSNDWEYQFQFTRAAETMVVFFRQSNLSKSQEVEVLDAAWRGIPIIWAGTTTEGVSKALWWFQMMRRENPCLVSHFYDARDLDDDAQELARRCRNLATVPKPKLPAWFRVGQPIAFEHQICEAREDGWVPKDVSTDVYRPTVRIEFGSHIIKNPFAGDARRSALALSKIAGRVVPEKKGVIAAEIEIDRPGIGELKVVWETLDGKEPEWCPFGSLVLHWDFTCDEA